MSSKVLERPPKVAPIHTVESVAIPKDFLPWRMSVSKYHEFVAAANAGYQRHQAYGIDEFVPVILADHLIGQLAVRALLPEVES